MVNYPRLKPWASSPFCEVLEVTESWGSYRQSWLSFMVRAVRRPVSAPIPAVRASEDLVVRPNGDPQQRAFRRIPNLWIAAHAIETAGHRALAFTLRGPAADFLALRGEQLPF
jgi:hypothetical protein